MKWLQGFWKSSDKSSGPGPSVPGPFIRRSLVRISVGLDFGTHATKVAFFEFGGGARVVRPLTFAHGRQHWPDFALPAVGLIRRGALVWGAEAAAELDHRPWNDGLRRLKVLLAGAGDPAFADATLERQYAEQLEGAGVDMKIWRPEHVTAAALAMQLAEVHRLLRAQFPGRQMDAQFTIPAPIDHVQHSTVLGTYCQVANTAHGLVAGDGTLRVPVQELVPAAAAEFPGAARTELPDGRMYVLPEAVAQVAAYLTSLEKTPGVHGVVDIGAGTTDVSVFSLRYSDGERQECYWYSAMAIPKAATFVQHSVVNSLPSDHAHRLTEADVLRECSNNKGEVERALEAIWRDSRAAWFDAYGHLKKETAWRGCPVFLCGGGALLPRAEGVFRQCWVPNWPPHELRDLPIPRDYQGGGVPFRRMAVAYGLAIPKPEHGYGSSPDGGGGPVLPKDSPDHTPPKRYIRFEGMGGDQLYPTPGWC